MLLILSGKEQLASFSPYLLNSFKKSIKMHKNLHVKQMM